MEKAALKIEKRRTSLVHIVPAVVVTAALITSGAIAIFASPGAGTFVFATTIGSVLTAYLTGKPWKRAETK